MLVKNSECGNVQYNWISSWCEAKNSYDPCQRHMLKWTHSPVKIVKECGSKKCVVMGGSAINRLIPPNSYGPLKVYHWVWLLESKWQNHRLIRIQLINYWFPLMSAKARPCYKFRLKERAVIGSMLLIKFSFQWIICSFILAKVLIVKQIL